jgi:hypothetical protein
MRSMAPSMVTRANLPGGWCFVKTKHLARGVFRSLSS